MSYKELADRLSTFINDEAFLDAVDEAAAILRSLDAQEPTVDGVMEQAQVFASAWALVGSRFVSGSGLEEAEQEKKDLRALVEALAAPVAAQPTEQEQSQFFCGVDFADGVLAVSVMRRRPDDVAELIHSEQIEVAAQPQQASAPTPCCGYSDSGAIKWNRYNNAVQCHNCGQVYSAQPQQAKPLSDEQRTSIIRANKKYHDSDEIDPYGVIDDVEAYYGIKEQG